MEEIRLKINPQSGADADRSIVNRIAVDIYGAVCLDKGGNRKIMIDKGGNRKIITGGAQPPRTIPAICACSICFSIICSLTFPYMIASKIFIYLRNAQ